MYMGNSFVSESCIEESSIEISSGVCAYLYIHVDLCMYICTYVYIEKKLLREGKSTIFTRMAGYQRRDL